MLTLDRLKELLSYCPDTGMWRWLVTNSNRAPAGSAAGNIDGDGYLRIGIDGGSYKGSLLAWFYMTGEWPTTDVDHRDLDRQNDRWCNLRLGTRSQNLANKQVRGDSSVGLKGVGHNPYSKRKPFRADIKVNGARKYLGCYSTPEAAHAAYVRAATDAFGEFARA